MPREIEHKFLVRSEQWDPGDVTPIPIVQGYLSTDAERVVRIRMAGDEGYVTIKGRNTGIARPEFEYRIPAGEAGEILDGLCLRPLVEKRRYRIPFHGNTWEVDVFGGDNAGLVVAEIELDAIDEPFDRPPWLGAEVSGDSRYQNASLVAHPYRTWSSG